MYKPDKLDFQILEVLMNNSKKSYAEIGKELFCSAGTVHGRVKRLEQFGIIQYQQMKVDYKKLGYDVAAFLGIYLTSSSMYEEVANKLNFVEEVTGLHYTTGAYSMFAKIICKDTDHLMQVLHKKIQSIKGIARTETLISLKENIDRPLKMELPFK